MTEHNSADTLPRVDAALKARQARINSIVDRANLLVLLRGHKFSGHALSDPDDDILARSLSTIILAETAEERTGITLSELTQVCKQQAQNATSNTEH